MVKRIARSNRLFAQEGVHLEQPRPVYYLKLKSLPSTLPPEVRLRQLLKAALRMWRLECVWAVDFESWEEVRWKEDGKK